MNTLPKARILLVDDEVDFATLTAEFLETRGYRVEVVHTGQAALEKVKDKPDLVLLDRTLTDGDGLEVCKKIRQDDDLRYIPIIILSALDMTSQKSEGLHLGADDYVSKPFDSDELLARIDAVLRRRDFTRNEFKSKEVVITELKRIMDNGLITPFFQPIFYLESKKLLGVEALTRPSEDSFLNNPETLFKAAINYGKYFELEVMAWKKAIKAWQASRSKGKILLNCCPYFIEDTKFDQHVFIHEIEVPPENIILEITERLAIVDYSRFIEKLLRLKSEGFMIAVDDVGSGYSGLETIAELKPQLAKIDMSLVHNVHRDNLKQDIISAIVAFCHKGGIRIIAEGIETQEELDKMKALGADAVQGYFLARPSPKITDYKSVKF